MAELEIKLFFSYSHKDEILCLEFQKHLRPLKRAGIISNWFDREIKAGSDWNNSIKTNLANSDIILFLISPDFLNSEYIFENEIKQALEQHNSGTSIVVPIMLRKCDIEFTPFKHIQGLPTDLEPINSKKWFTIDDAMFDIIEGLKKIIMRVKERKSVLTTEDFLWKDALERNTIDSYVEYLRNSKLKIKINDALAKIGALNNNQRKTFNPNVNYELEIELLERDRRRVSTELHDNVASQLILIRLMLRSLKLDSEIDNSLKLAVEEVISSVRKISRSLSIDHNENEFDLKESILKLQSTILITNKLDFEIEFKDFDQIKDPQLEINIYRIIQELLSNVIEHSEADKVYLLIEKNDEFVVLSVIDNGKGFDISEEKHGIGLANIKSRIKYYNGEEKLISNKNGTSITIRLPIN